MPKWDWNGVLLGAVVAGAGLALLAKRAPSGASVPPPFPPGHGTKGASLPSSFWLALWASAKALGADPADMAKIMWAESGINPVADHDGCVGINQFCPGTFEHFVPMSREQYKKLPAEKQLPFVTQFWKTKPAAARQSARDLYWVNFVPATYKPNMPDSFDVLTGLSAADRANIILQNPHFSDDGATIPAGNLSRFLEKNAKSEEFQHILSLIDEHAPPPGQV